MNVKNNIYGISVYDQSHVAVQRRLDKVNINVFVHLFQGLCAAFHLIFVIGIFIVISMKQMCVFWRICAIMIIFIIYNELGYSNYFTKSIIL